MILLEVVMWLYKKMGLFKYHYSFEKVNMFGWRRESVRFWKSGCVRIWEESVKKVDVFELVMLKWICDKSLLKFVSDLMIVGVYWFFAKV